MNGDNETEECINKIKERARSARYDVSATPQNLQTPESLQNIGIAGKMLGMGENNSANFQGRYALDVPEYKAPWPGRGYMDEGYMRLYDRMKNIDGGNPFKFPSDFQSWDGEETERIVRNRCENSREMERVLLRDGGFPPNEDLSDLFLDQISHEKNLVVRMTRKARGTMELRHARELPQAVGNAWAHFCNPRNTPHVTQIEALKKSLAGENSQVPADIPEPLLKLAHHRLAHPRSRETSPGRSI